MDGENRPVERQILINRPDYVESQKPAIFEVFREDGERSSIIGSDVKTPADQL
jgi:hypothetical protein